jgi:[acyl-carrier-protein] S-malonyltransferase
MTVALLFPGQGTQHDAMLPWLESMPAARPALDLMAADIGGDWRARLGDLRWSQSNRVAQVLVTGSSLATFACLAAQLPRIVAVAGYSVGEVAACVAAGMLDAPAALMFAAQRAEAMDDCATGSDAGLLALSNVAPADLAEACDRWQLQIAIRIGPQRCIVGGAVSGLLDAERFLGARHVKTTLLGVRVASHTRAMCGAVAVLRHALATLDWHAPHVAWIADSRGAVVRDVAEVRAALAEQVATTVRWDECMDTVAERRPDCVLEVGPGTTLARMWRERHPDLPMRSCDEFADAAAILRWVGDSQPR